MATQLHSALLDVTFDQLRTLLTIRQTGSPRKAALALDREQSSVQKQLNTLNGYFQAICGEPLAIKRSRGRDYDFTLSCERVVELASTMLDTWATAIEERRAELGRRLVIGTTTFTLPILGQVWSAVREALPHYTELKVVHVKTKDFWKTLDDRAVDLLIGAKVVGSAKEPVKLPYDFLEWHRDKLLLLTNYTPAELSGASISPTELQQYPLILPDGGIIVDCIARWFGPEFRSKLNIISLTHDIYYEIALLRLEIVRGFVLAIASVADTAEASTAQLLGHPSGESLRVLRRINLDSGFEPLEVVGGVFARKGERERLEREDRNHPLAVFWRAFKEGRPAGAAAGDLK